MHKTNLQLLLLWVGIILPVVAAWAADPEPFTPEAGSQAETKPDSFWVFTPDPELPNVLILGDSISIGYTLPVRRMLAGKANVFRPMLPSGKHPANCEGTTAGLKRLDAWLGDRKWDVIHFNWGLHDLKHVAAPGSSKNSNNPDDPVQATVEVYTRNLEQIVQRLKQTGARLIFATTTPVAPETKNPPREPDAPPKYNAAALKIMEANGVRVNDLFALSEPRLQEFQQPRNVHFTKAGSDALARQVADAIQAELAVGD